MKRIGFFLCLMVYLPTLAQVEISNKNFNYFDLLQIENHQMHSQIFVSASCDEIGYSLERYHYKKHYFSWTFSGSYKRLLPNLGKIWVPLTTQWQAYFPINGMMGSMKFKWFFNHRKFSFAGFKWSGAYLWTNEQDLYHRITLHGPASSLRDHLYWARNIRAGFDLLAGRKLVNKMISEIWVEAGFRLDRSHLKYECLNCPGTTPTPTYSRNLKAMLHFQILMAFDLFS